MVSSFVFYEVSVCMSESACSVYVSYTFPWGLLIYVLSNSALFYFILSFLDACFVTREQERVWICVNGKVERIWEELVEGKPGSEYIV